MPQADDCVWQVDHLQSLTAPPRQPPPHPDACSNLDMSDFRAQEKTLEVAFSRAKWYSSGFDVTRKMPFVYYFHKTLGQSRKNSGWHAECPEWGSWKQELSRFPCRQILTGWDRPPARAASSCKLLICPERTSSKYWARPLHTAHNCNNSAFPATYES